MDLSFQHLHPATLCVLCFSVTACAFATLCVLCFSVTACAFATLCVLCFSVTACAFTTLEKQRGPAWIAAFWSFGVTFFVLFPGKSGRSRRWERAPQGHYQAEGRGDQGHQESEYTPTPVCSIQPCPFFLSMCVWCVCVCECVWLYVCVWMHVCVRAWGTQIEF